MLVYSFFCTTFFKGFVYNAVLLPRKLYMLLFMESFLKEK